MTVTNLSAGSADMAEAPAKGKLRPGVLTALVIGSMVGSGVFNLPQIWPPAQIRSPLSLGGGLLLLEC